MSVGGSPRDSLCVSLAAAGETDVGSAEATPLNYRVVVINAFAVFAWDTTTLEVMFRWTGLLS